MPFNLGEGVSPLVVNRFRWRGQGRDFPRNLLHFFPVSLFFSLFFFSLYFFSLSFFSPVSLFFRFVFSSLSVWSTLLCIEVGTASAGCYHGTSREQRWTDSRRGCHAYLCLALTQDGCASLRFTMILPGRNESNMCVYIDTIYYIHLYTVYYILFIIYFFLHSTFLQLVISNIVWHSL